MTLLSLDASVASDLKHGRVFRKGTTQADGKATARPLPRVNLRKRRHSGKKVPLPSVNSAFLSGLFADVANASPVAKIEQSPKPVKKARFATPTAGGMHRHGHSFLALSEALPCIPLSPQDPLATSPIDSNIGSLNQKDCLHDDEQQQTNCVTSTTSADTSSACAIAFPRLPASISDASCTKPLTRVISDLQTSVDEESADAKESYGWFVEMEDETTQGHVAASVDLYASSANDLAFSAHTAPNAGDHDAEVEWAKAADTVDDVLADFF